MVNYKSVVKALIDEAKKNDYLLEILNDGEESRFVRSDEKMTDICNNATSTDMAKLTFVSPFHKNARFTVFLVFGNNLDETIADHTFTEDAEKICNSVIQHFNPDFQPIAFFQ